MAKILIVDDSATIRATIAAAVRGMGLEPLEAESGEKAVELFRAERPSLVLLDVNMPGIDGYETARRLRGALPDEWTPIIFLSASEDDQDLQRAIESGGDDYLVKPVSFVVLSAKIRAARRLDQMRGKLLEMSRELAAANQRLELLASQDGLTGIANRRAFDALMQRYFAQSARQGTPLSVVLCDVDNFKSYNDRYGHPAGDECLRQVGAAVGRSCRRASDLAARYGGEEFALLLPDTAQAGALQVVEGIRNDVASLAIVHEASATAPVVTLSAGIATYAAERDRTPFDLIERADAALYRAKELGRNRCVCA